MLCGGEARGGGDYEPTLAPCEEGAVRKKGAAGGVVLPCGAYLLLIML